MEMFNYVLIFMFCYKSKLICDQSLSIQIMSLRSRDLTRFRNKNYVIDELIYPKIYIGNIFL